MRWRLILWGIAAAAFGMPLSARRALMLFVAPSVCSSCAAMRSSRAGLHYCCGLLCRSHRCLQIRFSNNVVAGQRCLGRLLAPCWQQRSACVASSWSRAAKSRVFSVPDASQRPHEESRAFAQDSSRAFFSGPSSRSLAWHPEPCGCDGRCLAPARRPAVALGARPTSCPDHDAGGKRWR